MNRIKRTLLGFGVAAVALAASAEGRAETAPGDACTTANDFIRVGGPETGGTVHFMICDGANWQSVTTILNGGNVGIGETVPGAKLDVNGDIILQTGTSVNEFSIDGTLAGNSDDAVPTEKAVKTYVDAAAGGDNQKFTSNGTFTVPAGVTLVHVTLCGGGGSGGGSASSDGGGGGSGAVYIGVPVDVTPSQNISVTVGSGGSGGGIGGRGDDTSFGTLPAVGFGGGGADINSGSGGAAGGGGGGYLYSFNGGSDGNDGGNGDAGGKTNFWGGGGGAGSPFGEGGDAADGSGADGEDGSGYCSGGGGANGTTGSSPGDGAPGFVLVEW